MSIITFLKRFIFWNVCTSMSSLLSDLSYPRSTLIFVLHFNINTSNFFLIFFNININIIFSHTTPVLVLESCTYHLHHRYHKMMWCLELFLCRVSSLVLLWAYFWYHLLSWVFSFFSSPSPIHIIFKYGCLYSFSFNYMLNPATLLLLSVFFPPLLLSVLPPWSPHLLVKSFPHFRSFIKSDLL